MVAHSFRRWNHSRWWTQQRQELMSYFVGADGPVNGPQINNKVAELAGVNNVLGVSVHTVLYSVNHVIFAIDVDPSINNIFEVLDLVLGELPPYQFRFLSSAI